LAGWLPASDVLFLIKCSPEENVRTDFDISNTDYAVFVHHTVAASGNVSVNRDNNNQERQCTRKRSAEARFRNHY
jgi:hypothetical protein